MLGVSWLRLAIVATTFLVFAIDILTPLDIAAWTFYSIPLCLSGLWSGSTRQFSRLAVWCSGLLVAGLLLSPPSDDISRALISRSLGLAALWATVVVIFVARNWRRSGGEPLRKERGDDSLFPHRSVDEASSLPNEELSDWQPTLDEFVASLTDSRVMAGREIEQFLARYSGKESPRTAAELGQRLIDAGELTEYQARIIRHGRTAGLVYGEFIIRQPLGRGGMGIVFCAQHRTTKHLCALKLLHASIACDRNLLQRFIREFESAKQLDHPNLVKVYEFGCDRGVYYFVMELVSGRDLRQVVHELGAIDWRSAVKYTLQAAKGLHYIHAAGIVHRDIKPSNLMLDERNRIRILDLGLARLPSFNADSGDATELTEFGMVLGSLDFMSPEQALDATSVDVRTDIYSLGATLYFMLTGEAFVRGASAGEKLRWLLADPPRDPPSATEEHGDVPSYVDTIFRRMVHPDLSQRFARIEEVIAELTDCYELLSGRELSPI